MVSGESFAVSASLRLFPKYHYVGMNYYSPKSGKPCVSRLGILSSPERSDTTALPPREILYNPGMEFNPHP